MISPFRFYRWHLRSAQLKAHPELPTRLFLPAICFLLVWPSSSLCVQVLCEALGRKVFTQFEYSLRGTMWCGLGDYFTRNGIYGTHRARNQVGIHVSGTHDSPDRKLEGYITSLHCSCFSVLSVLSVCLPPPHRAKKVSPFVLRNNFRKYYRVARICRFLSQLGVRRTGRNGTENYIMAHRMQTASDGWNCKDT